MGEDESPDRPPKRSLDEIRAMILELQARVSGVNLESALTPKREVKVDTDGDELLFIGEPGPGHNCNAMGCASNGHIIFRAHYANILMTRKSNRLLRKLLKLQDAT